MGRELRMVPPNYQHPKHSHPFRHKEEYTPMHDETHAEAMKEWEAEHDEDEDPPKPEKYRPDWKKEDMTWFQVYETVSEGTPITPPFATREELVEYLVANGDFWDQRRRREARPGRFQMPCEPWARDAAMSFVFGDGWAPTFVGVGDNIKRGIDHV